MTLTILCAVNSCAVCAIEASVVRGFLAAVCAKRVLEAAFFIKNLKNIITFIHGEKVLDLNRGFVAKKKKETLSFSIVGQSFKMRHARTHLDAVVSSIRCVDVAAWSGNTIKERVRVRNTWVDILRVNL